jgi:hypothetical protein
MSAGSFVISKYLCTATQDVHPIRVQPETLLISVAGTENTPPAGALSSPISAQSSQSRRALGVNARTITFKYPAPAPTGYKADSPITVPWLAEFPTPNFIKGAAVETEVGSAILVGTTPEKVN